MNSKETKEPKKVLYFKFSSFLAYRKTKINLDRETRLFGWTIDAHPLCYAKTRIDKLALIVFSMMMIKKMDKKAVAAAEV